MRNYFVNEGNKIGGQEPQALGVDNKRISAKSTIVKGQCVAISGPWEVEPTTDANATKYVGVSFHDAKVGEEVMVETEGFVKLEASATITAGLEVTPTAGGKVAPMATGKNPIGIAFNTANAGEAVYVKLR